MKLFSKTLNLVASENHQSPFTRIFSLSRWSEVYYLANTRYDNLADSPYPIDERWPELLDQGNKLLCEVIGSEWVDPRPLSGTHAMSCLLVALAKPGDTVLTCPEEIGGHFATYYMADRLGLRITPQVYSASKFRLDPEGCAALINRVRPALVTFDVSHQIFPHPIREIRSLVSHPTVFAFDASHTLGLITGGIFQNPLGEGADVVHGGTHKTFPGPQKGFFAGNSATLRDAIGEAIFPQFSSNYHLHHVLSLYATALEMARFGPLYAKQVVRNAKALGAALEKRGVNVIGSDMGFTETHQVWLKAGPEEYTRLQRCGIRATTFTIPGTLGQLKGIRMGTQYLTRIGLIESDMDDVARFIGRALNTDFVEEDIRAEVVDYLSILRGTCFSFCSVEEVRREGRLGNLLLQAIDDDGLSEVFKKMLDDDRASPLGIAAKSA